MVILEIPCQTITNASNEYEILPLHSYEASSGSALKGSLYELRPRSEFWSLRSERSSDLLSIALATVAFVHACQLFILTDRSKPNSPFNASQALL
jgi:hypothetical protein